ncbi:hypothetical protein [Kribbella kalugense]|uniref:hypothetical protein n=1 Tax=Kribbella kalugense TaxID=2512221 RepID=UPI0010650B8A|nr:hypothetical protein [Kribbella kalugense]
MTGPDGDWLDVARVHDLIIRPPGWKSDRSIRLIGAEAVPTDVAPNGIRGHLSVVGIWRDESIEVEAQRQERLPRESHPEWRDPLCPPPHGGWRHHVRDLDVDIDFGDLESSGAIVHRVIFRPSPDHEVLVVAATDVDAMKRQLSKHFPDQLCVVPSPFTCAQLDELRDVLRANWRDWRLESFGTGSDAQAQPFIMAQPIQVTAEMAAWADTLPDGLLRLRPAISPV